MLTRCNHCWTSSRQAHSLNYATLKDFPKRFDLQCLNTGSKSKFGGNILRTQVKNRQQVMMPDNTVDVFLTTLYDFAKHCCRQPTTSMIRVRQQEGCRISYRWHTPQSFITRYFVLVIIFRFRAYMFAQRLYILHRRSKAEQDKHTYLQGDLRRHFRLAPAVASLK